MTKQVQFKIYPQELLTLHIRLALVKCNIALDLVHFRQRISIIPSGILDFRLVGCHGVVGRVSFVWTVCFRRSRRKVGFGDGVGWELSEFVLGKARRGW
jgi:hypothetical protein